MSGIDSVITSCLLHQIALGSQNDELFVCAVFVTPAAVGFMADKLGNFTRVLILTLIGSAAFHSVLLFIPVVTRTQQAALEEASFSLMPDQGANMEDNVCLTNKLRSAPATSFPVNVTLAECQLDCTLKLSDICSHIKSSTCHHINESQIGIHILSIFIESSACKCLLLDSLS